MAENWTGRIGLMILVMAGLVATSHGQTEKEITDARLRGVEYLKTQQQKDGRWLFKNHDVGITALCTIALIENGVPLTDPVVQKGYEYVRDHYGQLKNTYEISLAAVLLSRVGDRRDKVKVKALAARLIAGQLESGGWHYTCPLVDPDTINDRSKMPAPKEGFGDNSCTQFAVLGLWVASRTGIDVDRTLVRVAQRFQATQLEDGGWSYTYEAPKPVADPNAPAPAGAEKKEPPKPVSGPSMTGAGLFCLAVAQAAEIRQFKKTGKRLDAGQVKTGAESTEKTSEATDPPAETLLANPIFSRGLDRTGQFVKGIGGGGNRYFMWSVERLGVLLGLQELGGTDWFKNGSAGLIKQQTDKGGWPTAWAETDPQGLSDTAFAVLFLRKANLGSDISRLLEGDAEQKFQIANRTPPERFGTLEDALAAAKPGDTIRIESEGPFKIGHLEFTKDLTLQAGFGLTPVFKYEVGKNRLGIKLKPETDPAARDMITVKGGNVTLEGIKLQMDTPVLKKPVPWRAIALEGGSLRLLNCMISESNKQGMAAVAMSGPTTLVLRNSVLVGGRAGVEIVAAGKQSVTLDNSVIFSTAGIVGLADAKTKAAAEIELQLLHSVIQAKECFRFSKLPGNVAIESGYSVYQGDSLGAAMLATAASAQGRTWKGVTNLFDVKAWIGADGKPIAGVKDVATFATFFGNGDKNSSKRLAPFIGLRQIGNYTHESHAQDWTLELPGDAEAALVRNLVGINAYLAGPGVAYDQYRETIAYTEWMRGNLALDGVAGVAAR